MFQFLKSNFCRLFGFMHEIVCNCYISDALLLHPGGEHFCVLGAKCGRVGSECLISYLSRWLLRSCVVGNTAVDHIWIFSAVAIIVWHDWICGPSDVCATNLTWWYSVASWLVQVFTQDGQHRLFEHLHVWLKVFESWDIGEPLLDKLLDLCKIVLRIWILD